MDVSQYLDIFIDETAEHIQSLSDSIMSLEKEPENDDTVNEIFRAAHSLKGMAGTMGFKRMQHLTHDMENVFQEVRSHNVSVNGTLIDILFDCLDAIENYLKNVKETQSEGTDDNEVIIKKLNDFLNSDSSDSDVKTENTEAVEPNKQEPPTEEAQEDEKKPEFLTIKLNEDQLGAMEAGEGAGNIFIGLTAEVAEECLLKAARAFLVFKAVEEFGEIIVYSPEYNEIEEEKFESRFSIILRSGSDDVDAIINAASSVSEIISVNAAVVHLSDYDNEQEAEKHAEAPAEAATESSTAAAEPAPVKKEETVPAAPAANKPQAAKKAAGKPVTPRTVRVDIEKLDELMNQVSELIIAKNSLASLNAIDESKGFDFQTFHDQIEYLERITTNLHESVMKVRMVPIETTVNKFPRMIRDLSRKLNKQMNLVMTGEDTELDRTVVDQIGDPLQHLLRNSADHGIESAELRKERGKPEYGNIFLNAYQEGNNVIIQVGDDGGGIDTEKVKAKAIERGIVTEAEANELSQKEIIDFLFQPSFSMAKEITDVSGRGVGLDVVKSNIEQLGGDVEVKSVLGKGSTFTVRLPLTLAIIQSLMVEVRDEKYAIALGSIDTIEDIAVEDIRYVQAKEVIYLRGNVIPLIRLDEFLDCEHDDESDKKTTLTVVVIMKGENYAGLVVDRLIGQLEVVIKSLGKVIEDNRIINGATILGDGEVALILDTNALI